MGLKAGTFARARIAIVLRAAALVGVLGAAGCADAGGAGTGPAPSGSGEEGTGRTVGRGEVVVASAVAYPPFEFAPRTGPRGFDIDLMDEVAERAGFEVRYENVAFEELIRGLDFGLYDAAISAITITPGREQMADFSDPYYEKRAALVVRGGSALEATDDLVNRTVGVQLGTPATEVVRELLDSGRTSAVLTFPTARGAFSALQAGRLDGVIHGLPASLEEVEDAKEGMLRLVDTVPTGARYGIAFPEESPLIGPANEALDEIKEDGTYEEIHEKWFGRPPERLP